MGQFYKHKELDVNEEKFNDYFNLNNLYLFETLYIIKDFSLVIKKLKNENIVIIGEEDKELTKLLKKQGFINIIYVNRKLSNYTSISYLRQTDVIYIKDDYSLINDYNLEDTINNFKKTIISNNIDILKELKLINDDISKYNIVIDKYGIVNSINA